MDIGSKDDLEEAVVSDENLVNSLEVDNHQPKRQTTWSYCDSNLPRTNSYHTPKGKYTVQVSA